MITRPKLLIALIALSIWGFTHQRSSKPIHRESGVLVQSDPVQTMLDHGEVWQKGEYTIKALADFELEARVLSKELYSIDRGADLSPVDLALGWGAMSDSTVLAALTISQGNRFYYYRWENNPPISHADIIRHSANMHMIPASEPVEKLLKQVRPGQIVHLRGKLVTVSAPNGWHWQSSLTREDTGAGACELFRVESAELR